MIAVAYIQQTCFLSQNIALEKLNIALEMAQDDLRDLFGSSFYDQLKAQYETSPVPTGFSAENLAVYDPYIKKYLAWQSYFYFLIFGNQDSTPTGFRAFTDENSSILDDVSMYSLEKNVRGQAYKYRGKMLSFLNQAKKANSASYPYYHEKCADEFAFAITSVHGKDDTQFRVHKALNTNG